MILIQASLLVRTKIVKCIARLIRGHVKFAYMNKKVKQVMYLKCTICKKHFSENKGTIYFRRKKNKTMITQVLQNTTEGCGIRATARVFNISKDTVFAWVKEAGKDSQVLGKKNI